MAGEYTPNAETKEAMSVHRRVAVLDFGGQYVDMIVKAGWRLGYETELLPADTPFDNLQGYAAIIGSGSGLSSHTEAAHVIDPKLWTSDKPYLGICYGMQALAMGVGGNVKTGAFREDGRKVTNVDVEHPLFSGVKQETAALFTHGDFVTDLPDKVQAIGNHTLDDGMHVVSAIAIGNKVGVQFHPEVFEDTPEGYAILKNFFQKIAGLTPDEEKRRNYIDEQIAQKRREIAEKTAGRTVIAFISGGVDSAVATELAKTENIKGYYIDNGFMRREDDDVVEVLREGGIDVEKRDAEELFAEATITIDGRQSPPLKAVTDPQLKRQIIGKTFIDIRDQILRELDMADGDALLLQGTNAADRIESGHSKTGGRTSVIKTHHNQVDEVKELERRGLLLEPLDDLYKDEVRLLGHRLGLPEDVVERQPFPGPGLAIRIICTAADGKAPVEQQEQAIQEFVSGSAELGVRLLPVRSVGVGGDERSHRSVIALSGQKDWTAIQQLSEQLTSRFKAHTNRVIVALGKQPLDEVYETPTMLTQDAVEQLREADAIVFDAMRTAGLIRSISQFPVVLLPLSFGEAAKRSIVLRPFSTKTFMVGQAMLPEIGLPKGFIEDVAASILEKVPKVSQVFLDVTNKPPGTTEWE